jgi:pSer/pThr/pTyr-binding forkhead associated (FHA) protein
MARPVRVRFLLRRAGREVVLPEHSITVGRSSVCDIVLDGPRLSAEHARLLAGADGVTITDLGSRNGVLVNGVQIEREASLRAGDLLAFGDIVFEVVAQPVEDGDSPDSDRPTLVDVASPVAHEPAEPPRDSEGFRVLGAVIDKAIAMNHADNVEPVAADCLGRIAGDLEAGRAVADEIVGLAASFAVKLAIATGRGIWVNLLFRIYHARAEVLAVEHVDALYGFLRHTQGVDWELLGDYVLLLRTLGSRMTPAERFASKRIEGLLQLGPG